LVKEWDSAEPWQWESVWVLELASESATDNPLHRTALGSVLGLGTADME
jgi:hypothetical protein